MEKNELEDYTYIGDAGKRVLDATEKILRDASDCLDDDKSNDILIKRDYTQFRQDDINHEYISKIYSIASKMEIESYKIYLEENQFELPEGTIITDINNNQKNEFNSNEKFKILIPIQNLIKDGNFTIKVQGKEKNKPILYGNIENSVIVKTYDDVENKLTEIYNKNETKIIISKINEETKETIKGIEFNIYDYNKNILCSNLKTDEKGYIVLENVMPGTYHVIESSKDKGIESQKSLIDFKVEYNQEYEIKLYQSGKILGESIESKKEKFNIEKNENELKNNERSDNTVKKLPITGM